MELDLEKSTFHEQSANNFYYISEPKTHISRFDIFFRILALTMRHMNFGFGPKFSLISSSFRASYNFI